MSIAVINYTGRYIDNGFRCVAVGYANPQATDYYDKNIDLYGESVSNILGDYQFVLVDAGCG